MANVVIDDQSLYDIANAIREKNGLETEYKPSEMANAISDITTGEELPEEALNLTGDQQYKFYFGQWNWFINKYGNKIQTEDLTNCNHMFFQIQSGIDNNEIPFELNLALNTVKLSYLCSYSTGLKKAPIINININDNILTDYNNINFQYLFNNCQNIRDFNIFNNDEQLQIISNFKVTSQYSAPSYSYMLSNCYSMRKIPNWYYNCVVSPESTAYPVHYNTLYSNNLSYCSALDEADDIPVLRVNANQNTNMFSSFLQYTNRLKSFSFETNNNIPYEVNWKGQTIDLSYYTGYTNSLPFILNYNSGITSDKGVTDDTTYQALKNNPDWYTNKIEYSRYNHDSAVATINSLPDTSAYLATAGGTNTIKFKGASGSATDGGAINTLTEEEIAVAVAKGWTVSLV